MTYDPKNRPTYLGFERDRTNPNRMNQGVMSVADQNQNQIPVVEKPASAIQQALGIAKIVALILAGLASSIVAAAASGVAIPSSLLSIAGVILAIATPLGIASPGLQPKASEPKVGPPAE